MDKGKTSVQSTEGPLGSQRSVSLLTASQKRRVLLPSQQYTVWGSVLLPLGTRQEEGSVCRSRHGIAKAKGGVGWSLSLHRPRGRGVGSSSLTDTERREGRLVPLPSRTSEEGKGGVNPPSLTQPEVGDLGVLPSQTPRAGGSVSLSPHRHRGRGARCPSALTDPGGGVGVSVSLSPHGPRGGALGFPLLSRRPGPCPGGCPHRVPHEALEAEALLLGRAPGDDERLWLLAGPGRPRGRGRRHVPALAAPRPP